MSIKLHRSGLATVLASVTGSGTGKLSRVYAWPHRNLADATVTYPFATIDASEAKPEEYGTGGTGGINTESILTRILVIDKYSDTQAQWDAFVDVYEAVLTALRKDTNLRLGQEASNCTWNRIVRERVEPRADGTPPLIVGTIDCIANYKVTRT